MKRCYDCRLLLPPEQFYRNVKSADGLTGFCRRCSAIRSRAWREKNRARRADYMRRYYAARRAGESIRKPPFVWVTSKYGLTPEQYERMLQEQAGGCAICGGRNEGTRYKGKSLCVDHDHRTGKVRGLLCHNCNRLIGLAGDDAVRLQAAARYLDRYAP